MNLTILRARFWRRFTSTNWLNLEATLNFGLFFSEKYIKGLLTSSPIKYMFTLIFGWPFSKKQTIANLMKLNYSTFSDGKKPYENRFLYTSFHSVFFCSFSRIYEKFAHTTAFIKKSFASYVKCFGVWCIEYTNSQKHSKRKERRKRKKIRSNLHMRFQFSWLILTIKKRYHWLSISSSRSVSQFFFYFLHAYTSKFTLNSLFHSIQNGFT